MAEGEQTMQSDIRDNRDYGSVADFLKEKITDGTEVSVVSAYFTIYAYHNLCENLDAIKKMRFLFGEPTFIKENGIGRAVKEFKIQDDSLKITMQDRLYQRRIAKKCHDWIQDKVEIKSMVKPDFLHGKMYYIDKNAKHYPCAISGSSNFTTSGLGLKKDSNNIELNLIVDSEKQKKELKGWFDQIWNDGTGLVQDVKEEVLKYLEQLYKENAPETVYLKTLYSIFNNYLAEQKDLKLFNEAAFKDTEIWRHLYEFQKDGVKGAINKILKHNGCIIADSVGLGKTFEALAVIKYFELKNYRCLVLCPKKLSDNWTVYQASKNSKLNFLAKDRFQYSVLYHTDMGRRDGKSKADGNDFTTFNWAAYDLVVIDESHNFKGNPMEKEKPNGERQMNRAKWLMEKILKSGGKTKVLLLSATPVNNSLKDLRNQINLITEGNQSALFETTGIADIAHTLEVAQKNFTLWADSKRNKNRTTKQLMESLDSSFFKLLDELTIARSRKHIVNYYDSKVMGNFPKRNKPISMHSEIDTKDEFPSYAAVDKQISEYKLSLFSPFEYLKEDKKEYYAKKAGTEVENFTQSKRENYLIGMMKVNYLKRLESSINSFAISLDRTIDKINLLEKKIKNFKASGIDGEIENDLESDLEEAEENEDFEVGKKLKYNLADIKLDDWEKDLKDDKYYLSSLRDIAKKVSPERDSKLQDLKNKIKEKVENPINPGNKKVVVFTAFSDTAEYLYKQIQPWAKKELGLEAAMVCGSKTETTFGKRDFNMILTNFAPKAKRRGELDVDKSKEIDILIATDCISEGQNLQDGDYLINYDIHWNPVRIIQRFGRIDRLGSENQKIQLVNFWPTQDLDDYINLKTRVESRMALVDLTATAEDNILKTDEIKDLIDEDMKYRDKQLKRLKDEALDLEDMTDSISLTDFTLDDFRVELSNFLKADSSKVGNLPDGIYAVVPCHAELDSASAAEESAAQDIIKPGVIYCLRQKNQNEKNQNAGLEKINPLNPYFLVYVYDDGTVRLNYTSAKSILELYRRLCSGKKAPYQELCDLFNSETKDGTDMEKYSALLENAAEEISSSVKKRAAAKLTTGRGGVLIAKETLVSSMSDFELVTWLVIK